MDGEIWGYVVEMVGHDILGRWGKMLHVAPNFCNIYLNITPFFCLRCALFVWVWMKVVDRLVLVIIGGLFPWSELNALLLCLTG